MKRDDDAERTFRGRMVRLRQHYGWSQERLADAVGMQATAVTRIETGTRRLKLNEATAIAETFGVRLDEMVAEAPLTVTMRLE